MAINEIEGRYQYEKPVRVMTREMMEKRKDYIRQHKVALVYLLIEELIEEDSKFRNSIIERICLQKEAA